MTSADTVVADVNMHSSNLSPSNRKKRKHIDDDETADRPALPQQPSLPAFNLTGASSPTTKSDEGGEWQTVERHTKKKLKKIPKVSSSNYPAIEFSSKDCRLQSYVKLSDLQSLALYILADGTSPQFVSVRHRNEIRKVVLLMVPGLEMGMFRAENNNSPREHDHRNHNFSSPDDFYPIQLHQDKLPASLQKFANMFQYIWPVKTPGDDKYSKMHSPLHAMLTAPTPKSKEEKKASKSRKGAKPIEEPVGWKNNRVPITSFLLSLEELQENDYTPHPALFEDVIEKASHAEHRKTSGVSEEHGWVDTLVKDLSEGTPPDNEIEAGSITAGREALAMDCEMCMTGEGEFSLTRVSVLRWDGEQVMDELVKPAKPITNYLTQYSGITEEMLAPVTTTLEDIQKKLLAIFNPRTILIGHSLNSDLTALKMTHPYIIDTAILYPHPRGPPLKSSLKWLAQRYLNREIQKGHGTTGPGAGHDSREDARTCLDLVKQKCEKGKDWGTSDSQGENIFKRVARTGVRYKNQGGSAVAIGAMGGKSSAAIDWGDPKKGPGAAANFPIGCHSDEEVKNGVIRAVKGDPVGEEIPAGGVDFVWARFRELEALKGWWNNNKGTGAPEALEESDLVPERFPQVESEPIKDSTSEVFKEAKKSENPFSSSSTPFSSSSNPFAIGSNPSPLPSEIPNKEGAEVKDEAIPIPEPKPDTEMKATDPNPPSKLALATSSLASRIYEIYDSLPPCTAFIVYSGNGDPREMSRLQNMQTTFKREYKVKKWDELSVKWTDVEEQALKKAARRARDGIAFVGCK